MASENLNVFGTPKSLVAEDFSCDKYGVFTGIIKRSRIEMPLPEKYDWLITASAPQWIAPCVKVVRSYKPGIATYAYQYEGVPPNYDPIDDPMFRFIGSMEQAGIRAHPNFAYLQQKYGWDSVRREFPENMPGQTTGRGFAPNSMAAPNKSELFGTESWLAMGAVYQRTYVRKIVPVSAFDHIGEIVRPEGVGMIFPIPNLGSRNFLKMAPELTRRGNCVQIDENYMLSGPRGWNKDVYNFSQLTGS